MTISDKYSTPLSLLTISGKASPSNSENKEGKISPNGRVFENSNNSAAISSGARCPKLCNVVTVPF